MPSSAVLIVRSAFSGNWEDVSVSWESPLKRVLPDNPLKGNTFYDLKARPERYFVASAKLYTELGEENCKFSTRSPCVPCHCKFDTESLAQFFLPKKRCVEERKSVGKRTMTGCRTVS